MEKAMKMRPPAIPLITVDPYFSVWSPSLELNKTTPIHWTEKPMTLVGEVEIDGEKLRFMGEGEGNAINETHFDMSALSSDFTFTDERIEFKVSFYAPLFPDDLYTLSRPVTFLRSEYISKDGKEHDVSLRVSASEELCINLKGEEPVEAEKLNFLGTSAAIRIGSKEQRVLGRGDDNIRIDWGYLYLATAEKGALAESFIENDTTFISITLPLKSGEASTLAFAYDDIYSINYFGTPRKAYWHGRWDSIEDAIADALAEGDEAYFKCRSFSLDLRAKAVAVGGEKYGDLIDLAYRQVLGAHKLITDTEGNLIYISKECLSGGHSATVDVTYPASPFMLLYNTELLKASLRPIFKFAATDKWKYDFAPHDIGTYPIVGQQRYGLREGGIHLPEMQMPVEECGNMLILTANITLFDNNADFAKEYIDVLEGWVKYLLKYGEDPENQLCSDDFAGHLAHNCNLAVKAITGIKAFAIILKGLGRIEEAIDYSRIAKAMAESWLKRAANDDGSFRLAFDRPGTTGMKYNMIWDKLWKSELFPPYALGSEFASSLKRTNPYGMTFDSLNTYTKSDWLVWTAMLAPTKDEFASAVAPLWLAYDKSPSRIPMNDFYDTVTSLAMGCRCRSVVGGIFIKLLEEKFKDINVE